MTRLSIIIPVYNKGRLTRLMIESILANDFQEWELLLVDDGSDEKEIQLIAEVVASDGRIHLTKRDRLPKGAQTCRNLGLEKAQGEYVCFFDNDDLITSCCLSTRVAEMDKHPELDFMVFPSATIIDNEWHPEAQDIVFGYPIYEDDKERFAARDLPFVVCNNIYRRQALTAHHLLWDTRLTSMQDADFNLNALMAGLSYAYANAQPDYGYRIGAAGTSTSKLITAKEQQQSHLYAIENYLKQFYDSSEQYYYSVYEGILSLYNSFFTEGTDFAFAKKMASVLKQYSPHYAYRLNLRIIANRLFALCLPPKRARQMAMLLPLLKRRKQTRRKIELISQVINQRIDEKQ